MFDDTHSESDVEVIVGNPTTTSSSSSEKNNSDTTFSDEYSSSKGTLETTTKLDDDDYSGFYIPTRTSWWSRRLFLLLFWSNDDNEGQYHVNIDNDHHPQSKARRHHNTKKYYENKKNKTTTTTTTTTTSNFWWCMIYLLSCNIVLLSLLVGIFVLSNHGVFNNNTVATNNDKVSSVISSQAQVINNNRSSSSDPTSTPSSLRPTPILLRPSSRPNPTTIEPTTISSSTEPPSMKPIVMTFLSNITAMPTTTPDTSSNATTIPAATTTTTTTTTTSTPSFVNDTPSTTNPATTTTTTIPATSSAPSFVTTTTTTTITATTSSSTPSFVKNTPSTTNPLLPPPPAAAIPATSSTPSIIGNPSANPSSSSTTTITELPWYSKPSFNMTSAAILKNTAPPSLTPSLTPSSTPSEAPTKHPTMNPLLLLDDGTTFVAATEIITELPSATPSEAPTRYPTPSPTTFHPTSDHPTYIPTTLNPTPNPTTNPTQKIVPDIIPPFAMGPMVGHTTPNGATLWAYHETLSSVMELILYHNPSGRVVKRYAVRPTDRIYRAPLTGLSPSTTYPYEMRLHGRWVGSGSFTTAPPPPPPPVGTQQQQQQQQSFDYILASCMNHRQYKHQHVWDHIRSHVQPDFTLLAGDTIYLQEGIDVTVERGVLEDRVWFRHQEQRREEHFRNYIRHIPVYSTWNDHDYGRNDADATQLGKDISRRAWTQLWANPEYETTTTTTTTDTEGGGGGGGVYYSFYWGTVHYIVTDDHWDRDRSQQRRFGIEQTKWLQQELRQSEGTFKVIVVGSDIMQRGYSKDLEHIGKTVTDHKIPGVLFHAGDIHRNEYKRRIISHFPYPVVQISSSGIAKVWRRPYCHIRVDFSSSSVPNDPTMTAYFYGAATKAKRNQEWINEVDTICSAIGPIGTNRTAEHSCTETIRLSELQLR